jgi:acyl-CoA reductase-like NAD-dependent aldehyde dehydrogenase
MFLPLSARTSDLRAAAKGSLMEPLKFLVNNGWRSSGTTRTVVNSFTGQVVETVCQAGRDDIEAAISAALEASKATRMMSAYDRSLGLAFAAGELERRKEEFARLITLETGKPLMFSRVEVDRSVYTLQTSAEEAKRLEGELLSLDAAPASAHRVGLVRRFPLGVIGAITPFNFPLNLVCHKVGPAIGSGNTVVLKPSSNAPGVSLLLGDIISRAGFPVGTFNVIPCAGRDAEQLVIDKRVSMISFTGSPAVGWALKAKVPKKRVSLELGGNAGVILCQDADLDLALEKIVIGAFGNAGQSCISVQRIYVHDSVYDRFVDGFVKRASALPVGDPFDEKTIVGPMIDEPSAAKAEEWIREAVADGARVLTGGTRQGAVLQPTILAGVKSTSRVSCQEVFAPVVTVDRFSSLDEAIASVNLSDYGLQAGIFTDSTSDIFRAFRDLEVGGVVVNDASSYRADHMPYGGVKDSGNGREGIKYAMEEMTEMKLLALNPN